MNELVSFEWTNAPLRGIYCMYAILHLYKYLSSSCTDQLVQPLKASWSIVISSLVLTFPRELSSSAECQLETPTLLLSPTHLMHFHLPTNPFYFPSSSSASVWLFCLLSTPLTVLTAIWHLNEAWLYGTFLYFHLESALSLLNLTGMSQWIKASAK